MTIRTAPVSVALIFTVCGCGSSSPTSPATPMATSLASPNVSAKAQAAAAQVSLVSVVPGSPSGDGDWCIGAERITLTGHVVDAAQNEVTNGTIVWEVCESQRGGLPREACDERGGGRWRGNVISDLSFDSTPSIGTSPRVPVLGFRLQYRPAPGSAFTRAFRAPVVGWRSRPRGKISGTADHPAAA